MGKKFYMRLLKTLFDGNDKVLGWKNSLFTSEGFVSVCSPAECRLLVKFSICWCVVVNAFCRWGWRSIPVFQKQLQHQSQSIQFLHLLFQLKFFPNISQDNNEPFQCDSVAKSLALVTVGLAIYHLVQQLIELLGVMQVQTSRARIYL